jgi:fatty acid desaturase
MSLASVDRTQDNHAAVTRTQARSLEVPTLVLVIFVYVGWLSLTALYTIWPLWIVAPLTAVLLTLHSSLQHEILHGHPTRSRRINRLMGIVPLSLWIPYERYRQTHLIHHIDEQLTDPLDDPESYYWTPEDWARLPRVLRFVVVLQTTLIGRLIIGPFWIMPRFWASEAQAIIRNKHKARRIWSEHLLWCIPVVLWVTYVCQMPFWIYVLTCVVPGMSILLIRSFAEHRAHPDAPERTAIVENAWILGPLYLFNNLHAVHHELPTMPWYDYPAYYRANRARVIRDNGGLVYNTYFDVARRFLLWQHDVPHHPLGRIRRR